MISFNATMFFVRHRIEARVMVRSGIVHYSQTLCVRFWETR